jgi:hypothetical protein
MRHTCCDHKCENPGMVGSGSGLVHALSSYTRLGQQACAEQFDARSSIHFALERFKTVNVSLDRSLAPRFFD